jgi:hypothetical protein
VVAERAEHRAVVLVADRVGQMGDQRAAARDVHHLHPAADAEHRLVGLQREARERELERVALRRVADVRAAREHEPVQEREHGGRLLVGREQDRDAARPLHVADVGHRQQRGLVVPMRPARSLDGGAEPDHRPAHRRSKPRKRSQSVTAASKARSSTSA